MTDDQELRRPSSGTLDRHAALLCAQRMVDATSATRWVKLNAAELEERTARIVRLAALLSGSDKGES